MPGKRIFPALCTVLLVALLHLGGSPAFAAASITANYSGHGLAVLDDGTLWGWGRNRGGLALGPYDSMHWSPERIGGDADWLSVSTTRDRTQALKRDGSLWGWGYGSWGALGLCDPGEVERAVSEPVRVGTDNDWSAVVITSRLTAALKRDGTLWGWGLGFPGLTVECYPVRFGAESDWAAVAAGDSGSVLALKTDGSLWAWGENRQGTLGLGDTVERSTPTRVGSDSDWAAVVTSTYFTLALKMDGSLWGWGWNSAGQLGRPYGDIIRLVPQRLGSATDWAMVGIGKEHAIGLKKDGSLWAWGKNYEGQCGLGYDRFGEYSVAMTRIGADADWVAVHAQERSSFAVKRSGEVYSWGDGFRGLAFRPTHDLPTPVAPEARWKAFAAGENSSFGVREDGTLWAWGRNRHGRLGLGPGDASDRSLPTRVGESSDWVDVSAGTLDAAALRADGSLWSWGEGMLGRSTGDAHFSPAPGPVEEAGPWASVSVGALHTLALKRNGTLWAWGSNWSGELGVGRDLPFSLLPVRVGSEETWKQVFAGSEASVGVKRDGTLWEWGEMGYATFKPLGWVPTRVGEGTDWAAAYAGRFLRVAVKTDGSIWGWKTPLAGPDPAGGLPRRMVQPAGKEGVGCLQASVGYDEILCVLADGTLWRWNRWGGSRDVDDPAIPPVQVGADADWAGIVAVTDFPDEDDNHALGLKRDGTLFALGGDRYGQQGKGEYGFQVVPRVLFGAPDTTSPAGALSVDAAGSGGGRAVLEPSASDEGGSGLESMRFAVGDAPWTGWEPYRTTKAWTPTGAPGVRTVCAQFRDGAGNISDADAATDGAQGSCVEVAVTPLPGVVRLIGPSGSAESSRPVFRWSAQPGAASYRLSLRGRGTKPIAVWFAAAAAGCASGEAVCSVRLARRLASGRWLFGVRARNLAGTGPASVPMAFRTP